VIIFTSDLHIGNKYCNVLAIQKMLSELTNEDYIIDIGDCVDLQYMQFFDILNQRFCLIKSLIEKTKYKVVGNHDFSISKINGREVCGMKIFYPQLQLTVDNKKWLIVHGHYFGHFGWLFKFLERIYDVKIFRKISKWVVKSNFLNFLTHNKKSGLSMKKYVIKEAERLGCDIVVCGHNHRAEIDTLENVIYINPGSALGSFTYVKYDNENFSIVEVF